MPAISHLMAVTGLVMENGGNDAEVAAALLHDIVEDHGGRVRLEEIRSLFGEAVAKIVEECSDSFADKKRDRLRWKSRKKEYLRKLQAISEPAYKVEVADKLHNARMTLRDARTMRQLWIKLGRSAEQQVAYFVAMHRLFEQHYPSPQTSELGLVVSQLEQLCNASELAD